MFCRQHHNHDWMREVIRHTVCNNSLITIDDDHDDHECDDGVETKRASKFSRGE